MAGYYYGNPWSNNRSFYPSYSYSNDYNPHNLYYSNPNPSPYYKQSRIPVVKPRVVSIPVHYVDSPVMTRQPPAPVVEPPRRVSAEAAALRLQKAIRGFLVRKNVRTVRKIEAEVEEIKREIDENEEVLGRDEKARIRIGEMLMRLLFELDSVRGVRDYRKKVIKRVISLQEKVDSIGAREDNTKQEIVENDDSDPIEVETSILPSDSDQLLAENLNSLRLDQNTTVETVNSTEETKIGADFDPIDSMEEIMDPMDSSKPSETAQFGEKPDSKAPESSEMGMREAMEKMANESEKMKGLMEEICQRSAQQWRLMEGLVDRVYRLEKAVERMERKEKKGKRKGNNKCKQHWNSS